MENYCSKCGGELISGYLRAGTWLVEFIPQSDEKKWKPRRGRVLCDTCTMCGNIENIRVGKPEGLK